MLVKLKSAPKQDAGPLATLLMALGLVSVLGSSRTLREAVLWRG
jgi:hypothetical protein